MYFGRKRKYAAKLRAQERKKPSRIISLLLVISMLCGNFVGMSTGAAEMVAYCGMEEHTHSEACYCAVQAEGEAAAETLAAAVPTEETAAETTEETTAPTEGAALSVSGGSDAQALIGEYVEKELCCGMEEHKHDIACYSNPLADLETAAIWEATLPEKLSGDWGKDLAEVAKSQLGYAESAANYLVGADGETLMGYSRYGAWYSSYTQDEKQAYADWNVPFLFFCLYYAGVEDFPIEEDCADWTAALAAAELWREAAGEYIPEAGDLVFLDTDDDGAADRAAVVTDWDEAKVTAVESDSEGAVKTVTYDLTEDTQVLGYGDTNEAQAQIEVSGGEDAPQLMNNTTFTVYFAGGQDWSGYKVYAHVLRGDGNDWQTVEMTKLSDTYTKDGTTYNVYKADVTERFGGFDEVRFYKGPVSNNDYITANFSWVTKDTIEGKIYVHGKGWNSDYSSGSGGGGGNTGDVTTTLPAGPVSGYKRVYFDARLASLSYNGDSKSGNPYPSADGGKIYCYVNGSTSNKVEMKKINYQNAEGKIFRDVYYADISANATSVRFSNYELGGISWTGDCTAVLTLPTDNQSLCFYADPSDDSIYRSYDGNVRGGYWDKPFQTMNPGTVVDIPVETEENNLNTLYVDATFYDYYTDYELGGNNRDDYDTGASKTSHRIYQPFRHFNLALSSYYSSVNASNPIYWGNFQNYSGSHFNDIAATMNLYGYSGSEKKFFAQNNSMWGYDGNELSGSNGEQATMGLVSSTLSDAGDLMIKTSNGSAAAPYVNKAFLEGNNSKNTVLGKVYENVDFPFTKQELSSSSKPNVSGTVGYWVFDSRNTTLRMKQDSSKGYWLDSTGVSDVYGSTPDQNSTSDKNFFPFNSSNQSATSQRLNYGFATKLEIKFRLTENGTVKTTTQNDVPIEFNFSGDDDVWVFIDGELALDIGGGHGRVSGYLNFADKTYYVSRVKGASGGVEYGKTGSFTIKGANTDEHTLTMFYMERGLWESNMMITFNFPDENQLEVEKEVDTTNVNSLFSDLFADQKLFTFNIKNLATHFGTVNATSVTTTPISVDLTNIGTQSSYSGNSFGYNADKGVDAVKWYAQHSDDSSTWRHRRYGVIELRNAIDISGMSTMSFDLYYEGSGSFSLSDLYLQLVDSDVASDYIVQDVANNNESNAAGCNGSGSSLSGKTYGIPSTTMGTWVNITLDLSKFDKGTSYNPGEVKYIRFGCDNSVNIWIKDISFQPAATTTGATGFVTQQYDIPDYGSATSGNLEIPVGAVYTSSEASGTAYVIGSDGKFVLEDGETVNFHDQFRRGSYIYLEEVLSEKEQALYDTTWTMYENDVPVNSMVDDGVVDVAAPVYDMTDVENLYVADGRTEAVMEGTVDTSHEQKNAYDGNAPANSFVFRSYADPDSTSITTKLRVKFTNKVNTGSLTISKEKAGTQAVNGTFTFYVRFYNVGGLGLESAPIVAGPITLSVGGRETIDGIPLNTQYSIYEIKPADDTHITLDNVKRGNTEINYAATVYGNSDAYRVDGTITGSETITYSNIFKPVVSLNLRKQWLDADGTALDDSEVPTSIRVQLQYRTVNTSGTVTKDWAPYGDFYDDITISPGYTSWNDYTYEFVDLDQNVYNENNVITGNYKYRVVELDSNGNVIEEGGILTDTYTVTYGSVESSTDGKVFNQTITNQVKPKLKVSVEKKWNTLNNVSKPDVTVRLESSVNNGTNWTAKETVTLNAQCEWKHTFENLPDKSGTTPIIYRVVELQPGENNTYTVIEENGTCSMNSVDYKVTYSSSVDTQDGNLTNWSITNTIVPKVRLRVDKKATSGDFNVNNVKFMLEKQVLDQASNEAWETVASAYVPNGNYISDLTPGTYRLTETKTDDGYNLLASPITIVIEDKGHGEYEATVNGSSDAISFSVDSGGLYTLSFTVYNKPQLVMPSTGGVGGFEFWILGGLLIMAVPLLMYTFIWYRKGGKYLQR